MRIFRCSRLFLLACSFIVISACLHAQVVLSVGFAPPPLPVYEQPLCPGAGYIWTPGYWAYGPDGYYWVPGTWVVAPVVGYLWTPGYWGWGSNAYLWHPGYWGRTVGFYGGIDYGYGYTGNGYWGGYWRGRNFYYNRTVNHINVVNVRNVYETRVVNRGGSRVSYNGGSGGVTARPTAAQQAAMREHHMAATNTQTQHEQMARQDHGMLATVNHGRPAIAATAKPAAFHGTGVVAARNAPVKTAAPPTGNAARANESHVAHPGAATANPARPETRAMSPSRQSTPQRGTTYGNAATYPGTRPAPHNATPATTPHYPGSQGSSAATSQPHAAPHYPGSMSQGSSAPMSQSHAAPHGTPHMNQGAAAPHVSQPRAEQAAPHHEAAPRAPQQHPRH